jgi:hypothetical protein
MLYKQTLSDTQSGFRAISHSAIEKVDFQETDMAFATEMLIKFAKKGFKMVEVPSSYKTRKYGKTKLRLKGLREGEYRGNNEKIQQ